jgi:hypothetical protein
MLSAVWRLMRAEAYRPRSGAEADRLARIEGYLIRRLLRGCG